MDGAGFVFGALCFCVSYNYSSWIWSRIFISLSRFKADVFNSVYSDSVVSGALCYVLRNLQILLSHSALDIQVSILHFVAPV